MPMTCKVTPRFDLLSALLVSYVFFSASLQKSQSDDKAFKFIWCVGANYDSPLQIILYQQVFLCGCHS